ncbi:hypothetical protein CDL15_Pgr018017 [Punica granatum]|uniref:Protein kinase domain-containing protein n=1 Tax=Punica granatum TaxID=22663 RepID=A0A218WH04_PUNGR|nr:hypothetical protein CDL15_Pgr018017 [Punica granatum]
MMQYDSREQEVFSDIAKIMFKTSHPYPVTYDVVQDDRLSTLELIVMALQGDFNEEARNDWTREDFEENEITMHVPLMTGDLQVNLKNGMGTLGNFTFIYDSSIARSGKSRLGVKIVWRDAEGVHIREGISNAFVVEGVEVTRKHDAAVKQTRLPEDPPPASDVDALARLWSPLQNSAEGETTEFYDQFFESMWNVGVEYKHKQKYIVKSRRAAVRWLKLKAVFQWAILRRIVMRKRAQRMVVWTQVRKRLEEWSKGVNWSAEEHKLFLLGLQDLGKDDWTGISENYVKSKTPIQVARHAKKYFQDTSRSGINDEQEVLEMSEHPRQEEYELHKPADSSISQPGYSLTLFPSLLSAHGEEPADDEIIAADMMVPKQSEPMKSNSNRESAPPNPDSSHSINPLTLFPSLLTEHGDETSEEDFVMVPDTDIKFPMISVDIDELNDPSNLISEKQMHHPTATEAHLPKNSPPSSMMDREIPDDVTRQSKYGNEHHKIVQGNEHQPSNKPRQTALLWHKLRSPLSWLSMFKPIASRRVKQKAVSQSGADGEEGDSIFANVSVLTEDSASSLEANSSFKKDLSSPLEAITSSVQTPHSPKFSTMSPSQSLSRLTSMQLSFNQAIKATQNFSRSMKIGKGKLRLVYKGQLEDGQVVAIKRVKRVQIDEFSRNVELLVKIDHQNLVKLLGFIDKGVECLIVTEYVPNGTLRAHLDEKQITHQDVKSSNVLLTDSMRAKVADFGLAGPEHSHVNSVVKGTVGYLDPEYMKSHQLTAKSDVYSFGVLLLENLTGRRPVELERRIDERVTLRWVFKKLEEGKVLDLVDPKMEAAVDGQILMRFFELAIQCVAPVQADRPDMKLVGEQLWGIRADHKRSRRGYQV